MSVGANTTIIAVEPHGSKKEHSKMVLHKLLPIVVVDTIYTSFPSYIRNT